MRDPFVTCFLAFDTGLSSKGFSSLILQRPRVLISKMKSLRRCSWIEKLVIVILSLLCEISSMFI